MVKSGSEDERLEIDADGFTIVEWIVRCPMCHSTAARGVVQ